MPSSGTKGLYRRRRRNRRRGDASPPENQKLKKQKAKKSPDSLPTSAKKQVMAVVSLRQCLKFSAPEKTFFVPLHNYLLTPEEMFSMGYVIESNRDPNCAWIYRSPSLPMIPVHFTVFDVNAREFVPRNECNSNDRGQSSGSFSNCRENFDGEDSSSSSISYQDAGTYFKQNEVSQPPPSRDNFVRNHCRCNRIFHSTSDAYITKEKCYYHWGRLQKLNFPGHEKKAACHCCQGKIGWQEYTEGSLHVSAPEKTFVELLHNYLLTPDEMFSMGYPIESTLYPNSVKIYRNPSFPMFPVHLTVFDVNAREFVPKNECNSNDSGQGSGSSSDYGKNFDGEDSSSSSISYQDAGTYFKQNEVSQPPPSREYFVRNCCRCSRIFYSTSDAYITKEKCYYHWGRLQNFPGDEKEAAYHCCRGKIGSQGCTEGRLHVWAGLHSGMNGPYDDYVYTKPRENPPPGGNYGVYALDCEMCYTVNGLELTKITVVGMDGRLVYESFVKPDHEIVDYNTRFSGITVEDMKRSATKNLREVQNDLRSFINADTILVGHGLENDLRALKIVHYNILDTAFSFPHFNGLPYRRSLKNLTSTILKRDIQCSGNGHNSYEDARACMDLMLWRVRRDFPSYLSQH